MDTVVLNIQCKIDVVKLQRKLHIKDNSEYLSKILELAAEAELIARPKVIYKSSLVEEKGDNFVVVDGIRFNSRILRVILKKLLKSFPLSLRAGRS